MDRSKQNIASYVITELKNTLNTTEQEAMDKFYNSKTYKWFCDDKVYGIAHEGGEAIYCRMIEELNGILIS